MASKKTTTRSAPASSAARKKTAGKSAGKPAGKSGPRTNSADRDAHTQRQLLTLVESVVERGLTGVEPTINVPTRAASNTLWDKKAGILRMGDNAVERQLFNLGMARKFMQTLLHTKGINELIKAGKTSSLRGLFYANLHKIKPTTEKTFDDQSESDTILEDLEVVLGSLREELHLYAENRGAMVGNITIVDRGDEIDCRRMGSGGYAIPSIVEPDIIQFKKIEAKFVLHVEKAPSGNASTKTGSGKNTTASSPTAADNLTRRADSSNDSTTRKTSQSSACSTATPGHYIYSVIKQGSIGLAFESERLAVPDARYLGIRAKDYEQCELGEEVQIALNDATSPAKQIRSYPWFKDHKGWQKEIDKLLRNGFKMEVESLISKDISYVTEVYVPERLKAKDWLE